jgi:hypothetical protein
VIESPDSVQLVVLYGGPVKGPGPARRTCPLLLDPLARGVDKMGDCTNVGELVFRVKVDYLAFKASLNRPRNFSLSRSQVCAR